MLKHHAKDCFKINDKQNIIMLKSKKANILNSKMRKKKTKWPFLVYADFESILVPQNNEKQNTKESCTNKYQKYIACSYGY